jgi:hypothetical protein
MGFQTRFGLSVAPLYASTPQPFDRVDMRAAGRDQVELGPDLLPQPAQQRDQPRATLINNAAFFLDPGANRRRRLRQCLGDPGFQLVLLLDAQPPSAAFIAKARQPIGAVFLIQAIPAADANVVQQHHLRDRVQQYHRVCAPGQTMRGRAVTRQFDQVSPRLRIKEATSDRAQRSRLARWGRGFSKSRGNEQIFCSDQDATSRRQPPPRALMSRTAAVIRRVRMSTLERRAPSSIFCAKMTS